MSNTKRRPRHAAGAHAAPEPVVVPEAPASTGNWFSRSVSAVGDFFTETIPNFFSDNVIDPVGDATKAAYRKVLDAGKAVWHGLVTAAKAVKTAAVWVFKQVVVRLFCLLLGIFTAIVVLVLGLLGNTFSIISQSIRLVYLFMVDVPNAALTEKDENLLLAFETAEVCFNEVEEMFTPGVRAWRSAPEEPVYFTEFVTA